ncbi:MAG: hypothetical protein OEV66_06975 [Spirochaetia bacterium]|nr:hypothetical protein [Spirochaetia bacterium]
MRNPFPENDVFKQFLGLKDYFKKFQTRASVNRIREIATVARMIRSSGDIIAFDFLGSVNFGMAAKESDVDLVLYLDCPEVPPGIEMTHENCPRLKMYETLIIPTLIHSVSREKYNTQIVDHINLSALQKCILEENSETDIIARFVFYRTICRGVNKRFLHPIEKLLTDRPHLFKAIESILTEALIEFTRSSSHESSFKKYINRLKDKNIRIPETIINKIVKYLTLSRQ